MIRRCSSEGSLIQREGMQEKPLKASDLNPFPGCAVIQQTIVWDQETSRGFLVTLIGRKRERPEGAPLSQRRVHEVSRARDENALGLCATFMIPVLLAVLSVTMAYLTQWIHDLEC